MHHILRSIGGPRKILGVPSESGGLKLLEEVEKGLGGLRGSRCPAGYEESRDFFGVPSVIGGHEGHGKSWGS